MDYERWIDGIIDEAINSSDQTHPAGKVEAVGKILPHLRSVKDKNQRWRFLERIAERLHIDMRLIREEINKTKEKE